MRLANTLTHSFTHSLLALSVLFQTFCVNFYARQHVCPSVRHNLVQNQAQVR